MSGGGESVEIVSGTARAEGRESSARILKLWALGGHYRAMPVPSCRQVVTANCQISSIADTNNPLPMMLPLSKPLLTPIAGVTRSVFSLPLALRGGAEALPTFDFGLANTRLEGLAYDIVAALLLNAALALFSSTPRTLEPIPTDEKRAKVVKFNNSLKLIFGLCISVSVALGTYTTTIFTMIIIYGKTALGMGLEHKYLQFFSSVARFRLSGYRAFIGTVWSYQVAWIVGLVLNYDRKEDQNVRWLIALPAAVIGFVGLVHLKSISGLAGSILYS